jgi:hypothetical protein
MRNHQIIGVVAMLFAIVFSNTQANDTLMARWKMAMNENDEYLHALLAADRNVLENAKVLIHNLDTKKAFSNEMAAYHAEEIARGLRSSESYLDRLERATDIALDEIGVRYLAGLHQHYTNAMEQERAIQSELRKTSIEKSIIKMKAVVVYAEIKKAAEEQTEIDKKAGIMAPEEPVMSK